MSAYRIRITREFKAADEIWAVTGFGDDSIEFEETEKNGQEDTHIWGMLNRMPDGKWRMDVDSIELFETYRSRQTAEEIEAFFNKHGPPDDQRLVQYGDKVIDIEKAHEMAKRGGFMSECCQTTYNENSKAEICISCHCVLPVGLANRGLTL